MEEQENGGHLLSFTHNTEKKNLLIIFPNKIIRNLKEHVFVIIIFVLCRSVFQ